MKILGIDPGYAIVGYGVVEYRANRFTTLDYGAILTPAHTPFGGRLCTIYEEMCRILDLHRPDCMSVEKLYFTNNKTTGIDGGPGPGRDPAGCGPSKGVPATYEYTPMQVKQSVVGYGNAVKKPGHGDDPHSAAAWRQIPKPDDAADALADCHLSRTFGGLLYGTQPVWRRPLPAVRHGMPGG